ncbi:ImmA/IrrE family metallo-endopeptidase [Nonlabens xiamenensis]|uniref:ImmA/IrrE family metallo-endopeptidase n=1 Tax=Nonlabens xiamenensis TaxID=2341043 RepID=UPI000F606FE8|nr:ImmA/IrrE family metallo-endopeptidase [Nonlabens xiamenensis]
MRRVYNAAYALLEEQGINSIPIKVREIAEKLGIKVKVTDLGSEVSGVLLLDDNDPIIGVSNLEGPERQRFSIAHEIAHYRLHSKDVDVDQKMFVDKKNMKVMFRKQDFSQREFRREREANAFAAALLMPEQNLFEDVKAVYNDNPNLTDEKLIYELASLYEVSGLAMSYRLSNLGFV